MAIFKKMNIKPSTSNIIQRGNNKININGQEYEGNSVSIHQGNVIIDGKQMDSLKEPLVIQGNLESLQTDVPVQIHGDVNGDVIVRGSLSCGDISGDVQTSGSISCGDISGDAKASGSINCGDITGDVRAAGHITRA